MKFVFRLQPVLMLREHERSVRRQTLAIARRRYDELVAERQIIIDERCAIVDELRSMNDRENAFSTEAMIQLQRYADQLSQTLSSADVKIEDSAREIEFCLEKLLLIDQAVRSLEKLAERQRAEFESQQEVSFNRDLDDLLQFKR